MHCSKAKINLILFPSWPRLVACSSSFILSFLWVEVRCLAINSPFLTRMSFLLCFKCDSLTISWVFVSFSDLDVISKHSDSCFYTTNTSSFPCVLSPQSQEMGSSQERLKKNYGFFLAQLYKDMAHLIMDLCVCR